MKPIQLAEGIYDVGVIDWNIRDFHGYSTHKGTTYNAYLIVDEKIALVDTVKKNYADQLLDNIAQVVDPKKIDYVISNHTEMDHSGGLPLVMHRIGEGTPIFCSKMGQKNLSRHFSQPWQYRPVKNGDTLSLGKKTLTFMETRMVHWPDSMFTYVQEDEILFSSDGFGQHFASYDKFDDQVGDAIMPHAKKYFANILLLYAPLIMKLIGKVAEMDLPIKMICPDHGIIWRENPAKIIEAYGEWSRQAPKKKAVVIYDTMWHSTEEMARAISDGILETGAQVFPMKLRDWHRSDIMTEVLDAGAVVVGSPTLNNGLFPTVSDMLTYMKGLKPQNKLAAAFGSYGWSGESVKLINQEFEAMKMTLIDDGLKVQYVPTDEHLATCREYGRKIGKAMME
jgi:flavorubredoxin